MRNFYWIFFYFITSGNTFSQNIDPYKFIATLTFDNRYQDFFIGKQEQVFPIKFLFNKTQDGNGDGIIDVEDACENIVRYAIGDSIYGNGRTGKPNRGPNDQRPVVYFHFVKTANYEVYEYWLYYADNDYLNDHEHDWEKYFVYVKSDVPIYVRLSHHHNFKIYSWEELSKDDGHISIGVNGGSHAMSKKNLKGVKIQYNGMVSKNLGRLDFGAGTTLPWRIYTNDANVIGAINYIQSPDYFFGGDPVYPHIPMLSGNGEYNDANKAPWIRREWDNPPGM